jgi:broad specificity phosphatase PhoE
MVKTVHLVRHGHHALLHRVLCGRMPGVELDERGRRQMAVCARHILPEPTAIQSSPRRRARQSAAILAHHFELPVEIVPEVDEIDLGSWTACSFNELDHDPAWQRWNSRRGASRPPHGESMQELQQRVVQHLEQLRDDPGDGTVLIVSHAEPIRAALLHYANIPLDDFLAIGVEPASVSTLVLDRTGVHLCRIDQREKM